MESVAQAIIAMGALAGLAIVGSRLYSRLANPAGLIGLALLVLAGLIAVADFVGFDGRLATVAALVLGAAGAVIYATLGSRQPKIPLSAAELRAREILRDKPDH
jgi:hypothetical protein